VPAGRPTLRQVVERSALDRLGILPQIDHRHEYKSVKIA
jgi:hypothetical protein